MKTMLPWLVWVASLLVGVTTRAGDLSAIGILAVDYQNQVYFIKLGGDSSVFASLPTGPAPSQNPLDYQIAYYLALVLQQPKTYPLTVIAVKDVNGNLVVPTQPMIASVLIWGYSYCAYCNSAVHGFAGSSYAIAEPTPLVLTNECYQWEEQVAPGQALGIRLMNAANIVAVLPTVSEIAGDLTDVSGYSDSVAESTANWITLLGNIATDGPSVPQEVYTQLQQFGVSQDANGIITYVNLNSDDPAALSAFVNALYQASGAPQPGSSSASAATAIETDIVSSFASNVTPDMLTSFKAAAQIYTSAGVGDNIDTSAFDPAAMGLGIVESMALNVGDTVASTAQQMLTTGQQMGSILTSSAFSSWGGFAPDGAADLSGSIQYYYNVAALNSLGEVWSTEAGQFAQEAASINQGIVTAETDLGIADLPIGESLIGPFSQNVASFESSVGNFASLESSEEGIVSDLLDYMENAKSTALSIVLPAVVTPPESQTVTVGGTAVFTVVASGPMPYTYQWFFGGALLNDKNGVSGSTTATLTITDVQASNGGSYSVVVFNGAGSSTPTAPATLTVAAVVGQPTAPAIVIEPQSQTVNAGATVTFTVQATGFPAPTYQWYAGFFHALTDGNGVSGSGTATLTISNVGQANTGSYFAEATNAAGYADSSAAELDVNPSPGESGPPVIVTPLQSQTVDAGTSVTFTVSATGQQPLYYQWQFTGANGSRPVILSDTGPSLTIANAQPPNAGGYAVSVTNYLTIEGSKYEEYSQSTANLTVNTGPTLTPMQPVTAMVGSTVFINATVTGTVPFSFQWYFNGQPISNPTTQDNLGFEVGNVNGKEQNLVIANVQLSNVGTYSVTVSNPGGSSSGSAALTLFQGYDVATLVGPSGSPLSRPGGIGVDAAGNVYVADSNDYTIRKITPQGVVTVLAGMAGIQGSTDGTGSTARFAFGGGPLPNLAVDKMGDVYVADTENDTIRMITPSGVVTTLAGAAGVRGNADGTGSSALFNQPTGAAVDGSGNVYVADQGNGTVRMIAPGGVVTTLAGGGPGSLPESGGTGSSVYFDDLTGIAVDGSGNLYVTDAAASTIRKITPAGVVTTMAGGSSPGGISGSTDGVGTNALFNLPNGIAADAAGNVYVVDTNNATVRAITPGGSVTTLAGAAGGGYADGVGVSALFSRPVGIAVDASGVLYVADAFNNAVRECTSLAALAAPVITQQMASQTVAAGSTVIFAVTATGSFPFAYQWFLNGSALTDGNGTSGSATASLVITNAQPASAGSYAVSVSNAAGIVMAASATLAVDTAPSITTPPSSQTLMAGGSATFTVAASGNPSPSYLWQVSTNGGSTWTALTDGNGVSGSATVTLTLSNVSASLSGNQYQCVATNSVNSVTSTPVALTVNTAPAITSQPSSDTVTAGNNASFTVAASGSPSPTYQWQVSTNGGGTWTALTDGSGVSGSATAALTLSNTAATLNGYEYQCVVTNSVTSVTTNPVSLAVDFAPSITTQPSGATVTAGSNATFAVTASGNPAANFQWVISTNGGATFSKLTDDNSIAGSTTATLTISGVEASLNGNEYECKVTNSVNSVTTTPVTLVVDTAPGIATQPGPETVTFGSNASFTVVATGNPTPIYQWEISSNGGTTWTNLMDGGGVSGSSTATLTLSSAAAALNGNQYQCVVTNSVSSVTTTPVLLVVDTAPSFTTEPVSDTITVGGSASFTVAATGNPLPTYIWEVSTNGGSTWAALSNGNGISGATTATLTIIGAAASLNGAEYECVVTNSVNSVTTTPASLTVNVPPAITSQPVSQTVNAGSGVVMSVEATSNLPLTYQWFFDGTPMSGATGTALSLGNVTAADAGTYTVDVTSSAGTTPSSAATLTVSPAPTSSVITTQPMSQTVNQGGSVVFTVQPNGSLQSSLRAAVAGVTPEATSGTTYQWQFNGVNLSDGNGISGSTGPQLLIQGVGTSDNGDYDCIVTTGGTAVRSNSAGLQVEASSTPGSVSSISSRAFVGTGDNILIGGFYIVGSTSATVLVQAIGPALAAAPYNVTGTLQKPALTIHQNQNGKDVVLYSNTGWGSSPVLLAAAAAVYAEPVLQPNAPDSEVLLTLPPGGYTAEVTGADGGTGVALCGIYQLP